MSSSTGKAHESPVRIPIICVHLPHTASSGMYRVRNFKLKKTKWIEIYIEKKTITV